MLVIILAFYIDIITVESLGYVAQDLFNISDVEMVNLIYWGDTFISRIIISLLGTFLGGYVIGSSLNKKQKLVTLFYSLPILFFWLIGIITYYYIASLSINLEDPEFHMFSTKKLIPLFSFIFTMPFAYLGNYYGMLHYKYYTRPNSLFNIKWYNLIWFIPSCYSFAISILSMLLISIFYGIWIGENPLFSSFFIFIKNEILIEILSLLSLSIVLIGSIKIFTNTYKFLSDSETKVKNKFLKIVAATIYLWAIFIFIFNLPHFISFQFELPSLANKIEALPTNFNEIINFSLLLISGYFCQKMVTSVLKTNHFFGIIFEKFKIFRTNLILKIFRR